MRKLSSSLSQDLYSDDSLSDNVEDQKFKPIADYSDPNYNPLNEIRLLKGHRKPQSSEYAVRVSAESWHKKTTMLHNRTQTI